jgi:hypothetical protein
MDALAAALRRDDDALCAPAGLAKALGLGLCARCCLRFANVDALGVYRCGARTPPLPHATRSLSNARLAAAVSKKSRCATRYGRCWLTRAKMSRSWT